MVVACGKLSAFRERHYLKCWINRDIVRELASLGDLPLAPTSNMREQNSDSQTLQTSPSPVGSLDLSTPPSIPSVSPEQNVPANVQPRTIAGSRRANQVSSHQQHRHQ